MQWKTAPCEGALLSSLIARIINGGIFCEGIVCRKYRIAAKYGHQQTRY